MKKIIRLIYCFLMVVSSTAWAQEVRPIPEWTEASPEEMHMDAAMLRQAQDYALTGGGSGIITRGGKVVIKWGDQKLRYDLKSTAKSIGITALGLAIGDGLLSLQDRVHKIHPSFAIPPKKKTETGWLEEITLLHLATHTAGFDTPGGCEPLIFEPGTKWSYSNGGSNWLAECVTVAYGSDLNDIMFERVFRPIGITPKDLVWRENAYRSRIILDVPSREFGSGIKANVDAMARIGLLYLRGGEWEGQQIIPASFVHQCQSVDPSVVGLPVHQDLRRFRGASNHYGLLWWNNADGTLENVPTDAFWAWGLHESLIVVIPSLDIVAVRADKGWKSGNVYNALRPFLEAIAASAH